MTFDERLNAVQMMHEVMRSMNNENAYMDWIWTMPDEPSEYDFADFAEESEFKELEDTFDRIYNRYIDDGLFEPSDEELEFLTSRGCSLENVDIFR